MEKFNIEPNFYPVGDKAPKLSIEGIETNVSLVPFSDSNIKELGGGTRLVDRDFNSSNFKTGSAGWILRGAGPAEVLEGTFTAKNPLVSTHFRKIISDSVTGISIWVSDSTTPNGNLSGAAGDICLNGATNKPYYCTGTTNWTALV